MQSRHLLSLALTSIVLAACSSGSNSPRAVVTNPATNSNGTPATATFTARFDPATGVTPFPTNLAFSGTRDLTLNPPVVNPANFGDPAVALSALDGFSTVGGWTTSFGTAIKPESVVSGQSVRMFEVTLSGPGGGVVGVTRELAAGTDYVATVSTVDTTGKTLAVVPLKPLAERTSYMAVVTNGVTDAAGNNATPDQTYFLTQRTAPLVTGSCVATAFTAVSTDPLLPVASACALEPLRQLTNSQEAAAAGRGIDKANIVVSWVATTQSITPVLGVLRQTMVASTATLAKTPLTTGILGPTVPPIGDIYIGTMGVPYYLKAPGTVDEGAAAGTAANSPATVLTSFWQARPGAYIAAVASLGLDPTSTNLTAYNPIPVRRSVQRIPILMTVPNAASGQTKPATGWPVVIFQHGITGDRSNMLPIAATFAQAGWVVIAIDLPLHGITDATSPLNIANTPFAAAGARERTFNVDLVNNTTGAPGSDGAIDSSGTHFINLSSLLTSRDNLRQGETDLSVLAKTIPTMDLDADGTPDLNAGKIGFVGLSLGSIVGATFLTIEPTVNLGVLNVGGGGIAKLLDGSATFGPRIAAGLQASAGLVRGSPDYEKFLLIAQTAVDAADPINYAKALVVTDRILFQEVVGDGTAANPPDQVVPNRVAGAPLSGTEPMIAVMGLTSITATTTNPAGIRGAVRFTKGEHASIIRPSVPAVTVEMQKEAATMIASGGIQVPITDTSVVKTN
jgi:pimeloyl-ACP methyl ester carboxylesterase